MNPPTAYQQQIRPARLGVLLACIAAAQAACGVANNLLNGPISATLLLCAMMLVFAWLAGAFWQLRLALAPDAIVLGWGRPFEVRVAWADIAAVSVEAYPARRFLGWGWRGASGGDWAFSDVGVPMALVIRHRNGKALYITLRDAQAALEAVQALRNTPPAEPPRNAPSGAGAAPV